MWMKMLLQIQILSSMWSKFVILTATENAEVVVIARADGKKFLSAWTDDADKQEF